jgi:adenosylmethionine-8-amino-7-oxononanoate aminotransferase
MCAQTTTLEGAGLDEGRDEALARRHLLLHLTRHRDFEETPIPVIVRGEGCWVWNDRGKRYFDGLSGLFCVGIGYGFGEEVGEAVKQQLARLPYSPNWGAAHPPVAELGARIAALAPGDLNRVFFVGGGGSEANEAAMKIVRQYHSLRGQPMRRKLIARRRAYHGMSWGALSLNGVTELRAPFEPLMAGVRHVSNTLRYHRPPEETEEEFTAFLLAELEDAIEFEGPETVACVFIEPLQNSGGMIPPPAGYLDGVREICDRHAVLLVADEVICGSGRLGEWFGSTRYGVVPDVVTFAKGVTSAYLPLGGVILRDAVAATLLEADEPLMHGLTFGGHPASCVAALKNLDIIEREGILENVRQNESFLRDRLLELAAASDVVGEVRGDGYAFAIELVKDKAARTPLDPEVAEALVEHTLKDALADAGLICRGQGTCLFIAPPLIAGREELDWVVTTIGDVLAAETAGYVTA